jgi:hypothetical protein
VAVDIRIRAVSLASVYFKGMKGAFTIKGAYYVLRQQPEGSVIKVSRIVSVRRLELVASFLNWKKSEWHQEVDEETRTAITGVIDGYRRMARFAKLGFLVP